MHRESDEMKGKLANTEKEMIAMETMNPNTFALIESAMSRDRKLENQIMGRDKEYKVLQRRLFWYTKMNYA